MPAPARLRDRLAAAAADVARRQWAALGAATSAAPSAARATSIVDPEALLHLTAALAVDEPELVAAATGWMVLHSTLLSVQRVNNLASVFPATGARAIAELARAAAHDGKDGRWKALAAGRTARSARRPPAPAIQRRFTSATALVLQLRLGMGVSAKADVLAYLLGRGDRAPATAPEIAAATGYTVVAARRAADEMTSARFVHAGRRRGATDRAATVRSYAAAAGAWASVLGVAAPLPPWRGWKERFAFVADFLDDPRLERGSELLVRHAAALDVERDPHVGIPRHAPTIATQFADSVAALARWMVDAA